MLLANELHTSKLFAKVPISDDEKFKLMKKHL